MLYPRMEISFLAGANTLAYLRQSFNGEEYKFYNFGSWLLDYKTFFLQFTNFHNKLEFCPWLIQPSLLLAGDYPSEAPFVRSTLRWAPGLTCKHKTRLERLGTEKHSSLLHSLSTAIKCFHNIGTWCQDCKIFDSRNLRMDQII
jgi:hypothetical protein